MTVEAGSASASALSGRIGGRYTGPARGYSSIGRALRSQCRGWGFESPYLHQRFLIGRPRVVARGRSDLSGVRWADREDSRIWARKLCARRLRPEAEWMAGRIEHDAQAAVVAV